MSESHADTLRAFGLALLLHALLFVVFFSGSQGTRHAARDSAPGAISVKLVDAGALSAAMQRALRDIPETTGEVLPEPETELDLGAKRMPIMEAETESQVVNPLDGAVEPTQLGHQREAMHKQAQPQAEVEREKQADDIREHRAHATRAAQFAEQEIERIETARAEGAPGDPARADARGSPESVSVDTGLAARYTAALLAAITAGYSAHVKPPFRTMGSQWRVPG